jgi:nicotinamidase-related amidase
MKRLKFFLSSDQLELLLAFEEAKGLSDLADTMAKDPSVVSRNIQRMAEEFPVLEKVKGRWELTPLGIQTNELTRNSLNNYNALLAKVSIAKPPYKHGFSKNSVLIIINAQNGLLDATQAGRNNSEAERKISKILEHWRKSNRPVFHIKHVSEKPDSLFYRNSIGVEFLKQLTPIPDEVVIEKTKSSSFSETTLEAELNRLEPSNLVLAGFTANECIDATARDAAAFGFNTYVVGDATAMFDITDTSGKLLKAERIHKLTLANINAFYARVI